MGRLSLSLEDYQALFYAHQCGKADRLVVRPGSAQAIQGIQEIQECKYKEV